MIYLFGRTTGDAQKHLKSRYGSDVETPFEDVQEMFRYFNAIYLDPYKVQNAQQEYRRLNMKSTQTFTEFYTQFLHLTGKARILTEDWRPNLCDKLTVSLQTAVLPVLETLSSYQALANHCLQLDQELKRIKE